VKTDRLLLAEKLMLVLIRDDGKLHSSGFTYLMLGGAVLSDLILRGRIDVAGKGESVRAGRLVVRSAMPLADDLLDNALQKIIDKPGRRPSSAVYWMVKQSAVLDRLTAARIVTASRRRVLGLFPATSWHTVDGRETAGVRRDLQRALDRGTHADPETAVLVSLLLAGGLLHKVVPTTDRKAQKATAAQLANGDWATVTTRKALRDVANDVGTAVRVARAGE